MSEKTFCKEFLELSKYIICTPKRKKINEKLYQQNQYKTYQIFDAIMVNADNYHEIKKNNTFDLSEKIIRNIKNRERDYHSEFENYSSLGCFLSHRILWEKCYESGKPILIMEDDVEICIRDLTIFNKIVKKYLNNKECKKIQYLLSLLENHEIFLNFFPNQSNLFGLIDDKYTWNYDIKNSPPISCGTQCYIINPNVAKSLLVNSKLIDCHVDYYLMRESKKNEIEISYLKNIYTPFSSNIDILHLLYSNSINYSVPIKEKKFVIGNVNITSELNNIKNLKTIFYFIIYHLTLLLSIIQNFLKGNINYMRIKYFV